MSGNATVRSPGQRLSVEPGERYGNLTVTKEIPGSPRRVECVCACGTTKAVLIGNLVHGRSRSCGCALTATLVTRNKSDAQRASATKHGLSAHYLYATWKMMLDRCYNAKHVAYKNYGGRGIRVCDSWRSPESFISWIDTNLGQRPEDCTLDRIDNDGNYEPGNVRWATRSEQKSNTRQEAQIKGSAMGMARLTEQIVRDCRARWAAGEAQDKLAAEFGVSKPTMHKALKGKTWRHVE